MLAYVCNRKKTVSSQNVITYSLDEPIYIFLCPYTEIVLGNEKEQTTDIGNSMNQYQHLCISERSHIHIQ